MYNNLDVLQFAKILSIDLYPLQATLLKIIFGVPLDYRPNTIDVWDVTKENKLYTLSEPDYLRMCHEEMRCNYSDWRDLPPQGFNEAHLFQGRRSGKDVLLYVAALYLGYKIVKQFDSSLFNLIPNTVIDISFIGAFLESVHRFAPTMYSMLETSYLLRSEIWSTLADNKLKLGIGSENYCKISCFEADAKSLRGQGNIGIFLNEFTHYKNSEDVYTSLIPSTMNFVSKYDGSPYYLILSASSPWYATGQAFELHKAAFGEYPDIFTHCENTATLSPWSQSGFLQQAKVRSADTFEVEFGTKFFHKGPYLSRKIVSLKEYMEINPV